MFGGFDHHRGYTVFLSVDALTAAMSDRPADRLVALAFILFYAFCIYALLVKGWTQ